jgi:hypothetical protein
MRNAYLLNKVLKGEAVTSRCRIPLGLVSKFNRYASVNVRKQVTKAHRQHCQLRSSITDVTIDNIDDIDTPLPALNNSTIQELCMEIKNPSKPQDPAILGIDGKGTWASGSGIRVLVATKHEAEVIPVAENLAAYLYKAHGDAILQYLHPSAQEDALDTVWDPDTNCPISWEEQQAREAGADDTVPEWVQETLQEDGTTPGLGDLSGEGLLSISITCPMTPLVSDDRHPARLDLGPPSSHPTPTSDSPTSVLLYCTNFPFSPQH